MGHDTHSSHPPQVPAALLADRQKGWQWFTQFTAINCVAVAVLLILMLVFLRLI